MGELEIRRKVRERHGSTGDSCRQGAQDACCGATAAKTAAATLDGLDGMLRLGVGNPMAVLAPRVGETIVDLGSGPGRDVLVAAAQVGPTGKAIGIDATPEMVFGAREAAASLGRTNAEFRLGEIEHLPIESGTVDGIASDCVINLSPDKAQVFREAFRVLKRGGRIVVSDVVADRELPPEARQDAERWAACEAGAVTPDAYVTLMQAAGFQDVHTERKGAYRDGLSRAVIRGRKPRDSA